jgi:hypothetical protein
MMQTISVTLSTSVIYLYGTVNSVEVQFEYQGNGVWQAEADKSPDNLYTIHLEAYSAQGLIGTYDLTMMYDMPELITDRTAADVHYKTPKGYYNIADMNRVGTAIQYMVSRLREEGYAPAAVPKLDWKTSDLPRVSQLNKYISDVVAIRDFLSATHPVPDTLAGLTHDGANDIELAIAQAFKHMGWLFESIRLQYCNTFSCGQVDILP